MTASDRGEGFALPAATRVGRVALRVGSLDAVAAFYRDAVGLRVERDGHHARLVAGDAPLVLLYEEPDAPERAADEAGLFHLALRVPGRPALADALRRLQAADALTGASDHCVSEALYARDPEGNGVEVYRDRPREEWPRTADGGVDMQTLPLDLDGLSGEGTGGDRLPAGSDVGHVHLEVTDLQRAERFYVDALGMRVRARYGDQATFVAAGDYHHHVGLNTWNRRRAPAGDGRGLAWFELVVPDRGTLGTLRDRLAARDDPIDGHDGSVRVAAPDGIGLRIRA